jgi:hypothetical protein
MADIQITKFKSTDKKKLFRLTSNDKEVYIKLENVSLPFNYQKYNNNYYINTEVAIDDSNKLNLIKLFESIVKKNMKISDDKFISVIKPRDKSYHIKLMLKRQKNSILIDTDDDICLDKIAEYHKLNVIYDIITKPEILWEIDGTYGITFYLSKIIVKN